MKLSELRPCDNCGEPIGQIFYEVRTSIVMVNARTANQMLGLTQMLGGSLALAEAMGAEPDCVVVGGEFDPELFTHLLMCQDCFIKPIGLAAIVERRVQAEPDPEPEEKAADESQ